jgi:hypothetical protein
LTLLDLKRAHELSDVTQALAMTLAAEIGNVDTRARIAYLFSQSPTALRKPYVDLADLCLNLIRSSRNALVVEAARALSDFLISPQPVVVGQSERERAGRSSSSMAATPPRRRVSTASASTHPTWHRKGTSKQCGACTTTSSSRRKQSGADSCTRSRNEADLPHNVRRTPWVMKRRGASSNGGSQTRQAERGDYEPER